MRRFAYVIYGFIMFLLLLVPIIGKEVGGNKAWLGIGSFGVQPSEFAKFATALAVAKYMGSVGFRMDQLRNQVILFVMIGVPMLLILLQKDTGTALVFTVFTVVYFREGMSPMLIIMGVIAAIIFILTLLVNRELSFHRYWGNSCVGYHVGKKKTQTYWSSYRQQRCWSVV